MVAESDLTAEQPRIRVLVFGTFGAERDGVNVTLPAGKGALICRMLVAAHGGLVPLDDIVAALWPDEEPWQAERLVRPLISRLRRALGAESISATSGGWSIDETAVTADAWTFEALVHEARQALATDRPGPALAATESALKLLARGEPLIADRYSEWAQPFRRQTDRLARELREIGWQSATALEAHDLARTFAEVAIDADHLDESAWRNLMHSLVATGRTALAIRTYARLRAVLIDELGLSPSVETEALYLSMLDREAHEETLDLVPAVA
jgi:DNA-binding SARP family transcriptional activator